MKSSHVRQIGPYVLGLLALALVFWALPSPASDPVLNGSLDRANAGGSSVEPGGNTGVFSADGSGPPTPRLPHSTSVNSGRRNRWGREKDNPSRESSSDRPLARNLAQLASGEWDTREADSPNSGPQRPGSSGVGARAERLAESALGPPRRSDQAGGGVLGELEELERGYQSAQNMLYSGFGATQNNPPPNTNPFDDALDGEGDQSTDPDPTNEGEDSGETGDDGDGDADGGDTGDSGSEDGGQDTTPDPPDNSHPDYLYDFLVVGPHGADGPTLSRAHFTGGEFILEDESRVSFFPGSLHAILSFGTNSMLVLEDTNRDGRMDFLLTREIPSLGTAIELFQQTPQGAFTLAASTVLYLERIHSAALFDIDADSQLELLLAKDGEKRLVVFEKTGKDWDYREELVLPIEPALMLVSDQVANGQSFGKLLHIIDSQLQLVLNARPTSPIAFWFGLSTPLQSLRSVNVDFKRQGGSPDRVRVIEMPDRLILFDERDDEIVAFASIELGSAPPFLVIGDYSGTGQRQTIWLP